MKCLGHKRASLDVPCFTLIGRSTASYVFFCPQFILPAINVVLHTSVSLSLSNTHLHLFRSHILADTLDILLGVCIALLCPCHVAANILAFELRGRNLEVSRYGEAAKEEEGNSMVG